jgi:hypothetical protein
MLEKNSNYRNYLKFYPWGLAIYAILFFILTISFFGIFFERYEIVFNALASGKLTPGLVYNDFFYLAHVLLIKFYALLLNLHSSFNWLGAIQILYLFISFYIIISRFKAFNKSKKMTVFFVLIISIFFVEQIILQVYTRTAFLLSFSALLLVFESSDANKKQIYTYLLSIFLFTIAALTRVEVALLTLIIVSSFYLLLIKKELFIGNIFKTSIKLTPFLIPVAFIFTWTFYEINASNEFYKLIEPDVEYELTGRDNIVPISEMTNLRDTLRYMAIDKVVWGDATTNDANFLRSLIRSKTITEKPSALILKAINSIVFSSKENIVLVISVHVLLLILIVLFKASRKTFTLLFFHLIFLSIIFVLGFRIKMTETAISNMFFIVFILYLLTLYKNLGLNSKKGKFFMVILFILSTLQLNDAITKSKNLNHRTSFYQASLENIKVHFKNKNVLLNGESVSIFYAYNPLNYHDFAPSLKNIIIYDYQHLSTIEPYRTFLANDCQCDPNHYGEYFSYLKKEKEENVFVMSETFKDFLEDYLKIVHNLEIVFMKFNLDITPSNTQNFFDNEINAYYIE